MKKIYDSVHGFIHFNEIEEELINSSVFQRLHYIHQLGISYLIYPGGTHTRFEHSLGTMALATRIFDEIARKFPERMIDPSYWRQILRLAALCHDLGHLPFSHVAEKRLLGKQGHESWTAKIIASEELKPVWKAVSTENRVELDVTKMALGKEKLKELLPEITLTPWEEMLSEIIAGDFFGADRIDYLLRDAKSTGLSYGLFDYSQLIETLTLDDRGQLMIDEGGVESSEALLIARYFMQKRVYQYPSAKAYAFHLARFMENVYGKFPEDTSLDTYLSLSEPEVLCALRKALNDPEATGHYDALCLHDRHHRFQAIALPLDMNKEPLETYKKDFSIADRDIAWDLAPAAVQLETSSLSGLSIPRAKKNWLYLSPRYRFENIV